MSFEDDLADLGSMFDIEFANDIDVTITSGQKQYRAKLNTLKSGYMQMLQDVDIDMQKTAKQIFDIIKSTLIGIIRDRLPKDTGRLRAEFEKIVNVKFTTSPLGTMRTMAEFEDVNFLSQQGKIRLGNTAIIAELSIDISRLISAVPYAIYHIEELLLKDTYIDPTTPGTQPLDLTLLAQGIRTRMDKDFYSAFIAKGWNAQRKSAYDSIETVDIELAALLNKGG